MKELRNEIANIISVMPHMDEANSHGICHIIKTPKQAEAFIKWLKMQDLKKSLQTPIIYKAHEFAKTIN